MNFDGEEIIVIRHCENKFAAIGSSCSHYGAPLIKGTLWIIIIIIIIFDM